MARSEGRELGNAILSTAIIFELSKRDLMFQNLQKAMECVSVRPMVLTIMVL